jgi:hypothetical protein
MVGCWQLIHEPKVNVCLWGVKVMLTTLTSKVATSFNVNMFVEKHCLMQILCPILTLGETFGRIWSSLNQIIGVTKGVPWTRTKFAWRSSTQCMGLKLCNICAWINGPNIGNKGFFVLQVWYNSISTTCHVAREKLEKFFKALGMVLIVKLSKEARGYNWCPLFYECWTLGSTICISNNTTNDSCCIGCPLRIC